jgi:hypothetical protein
VGRAFLSAGDVVLSTTEVFDFTFARTRRVHWRRRHRWSVIRVLDRLCHRVGRAPTIRQAVAVAAQDIDGIAPGRIWHPPRQVEIIGEIATWPILPILQTMAGALNALFSALRDHSPPWVWSIDLAFSHGRDPVHGFAATREAAMQAFARSWFGENLGAFL